MDRPILTWTLVAFNVALYTATAIRLCYGEWTMPGWLLILLLLAAHLVLTITRELEGKPMPSWRRPRL